MRIVNMHEAKTHLSRLVDLAAKGEPFLIARAGKPVAMVGPPPAETEPPRPRRLGFLKGRLAIPEDFDRMGAEEVRGLFEG